MNMYDRLLDPSGGNEAYRSPLLEDPGIFAMDIGLSLGGAWFGRKLGKIHSRAVFRDLVQQNASILNPSNPKRMNTARRIFRTEAQQVQRRATAKRIIQDTRAARLSGIRFGKTLRGLGLATAALSLVDFGLSVGLSTMTPGISREQLDADRKQVFGDEVVLDTRMAYTQRRRALQAIHDSQISVGRALIGNEAQYIHR